MKVLMVYPEINPNDNPFVRTLMNALREQGCEVNWGRNEFWKNYFHYDIIHIHWPDAMFETIPPTDEEVKFLESHIEKIKKYCKIVYTRHNESPHYSLNPNRLKCYLLIEQQANVIVHMGPNGVEQLKKRMNNPEIKHQIIHHHIYDKEYTNTVSKEEARRNLKIDSNKFVVLTFGVYRSIEEAEMVITSFKELNIKNKWLLAPRLLSIMTENTSKNPKLKWVVDKIISFRLRREAIQTGSDFVDNAQLSNYFSAADVVLIQRINILNSGNVPMAFYFGKPVIGANVGNVGDLLRKTNNIVFDPKVKGDLGRALNKATHIIQTEIGQKNYNYAIKFMNSETVAKQYVEVYKSVK